jgi:hypothetical protein
MSDEDKRKTFLANLWGAGNMESLFKNLPGLPYDQEHWTEQRRALEIAVRASQDAIDNARKADQETAVHWLKEQNAATKQGVLRWLKEREAARFGGTVKEDRAPPGKVDVQYPMPPGQVPNVPSMPTVPPSYPFGIPPHLYRGQPAFAQGLPSYPSGSANVPPAFNSGQPGYGQGTQNLPGQGIPPYYCSEPHRSMFENNGRHGGQYDQANPPVPMPYGTVSRYLNLAKQFLICNTGPFQRPPPTPGKPTGNAEYCPGPFNEADWRHSFRKLHEQNQSQYPTASPNQGFKDYDTWKQVHGRPRVRHSAAVAQTEQQRPPVPRHQSSKSIDHQRARHAATKEQHARTMGDNQGVGLMASQTPAIDAGWAEAKSLQTDGADWNGQTFRSMDKGGWNNNVDVSGGACCNGALSPASSRVGTIRTFSNSAHERANDTTGGGCTGDNHMPGAWIEPSNANGDGVWHSDSDQNFGGDQNWGEDQGFDSFGNQVWGDRQPANKQDGGAWIEPNNFGSGRSNNDNGNQPSRIHGGFNRAPSQGGGHNRGGGPHNTPAQNSMRVAPVKEPVW